MKEVTVKDYLENYKGTLFCGDEKKVIKNISFDTRTINKDNVFFGIKTQKNNGSDYLEKALDAGVKLAFVDKCNIDARKYGATIVIVEDGLVALQNCASLKRKLNKDKKVVAVTGSVGKTTTKELLSAVLGTKYKVNYTQGNFNNTQGMPVSYLQTYDEDISVLEMGMSGFGEISQMTNMVRPDIGIITNIGHPHIGDLGSQENIFKAKSEILEGIETKEIVINNDDKFLRTLKDAKCYTVGIENESEIMAKDIEVLKDKTKAILTIAGKEYEVEIPLHGSAVIYDVMLAIRVGIKYNCDITQMIEALKNVKEFKRRLNVNITHSGIKVINDTYNASLEAMKNSIGYLDSFKDSNTYAVLGDMLDLGEYSYDLHYQVGQCFKDKNIKNAVLVGKEAKAIYEGIKDNNPNVNAIYFEDKQQAIEYLKTKLKKDDVVLVKASNGLKFDEIVSKIEEIR